jgi:GDP/UDP-N,N'-diacetylbacillosamine 2-epimerase (hydrolysing)
MKIGILTSSRADFGIYLPLLTALEKDAYFQTEIIAFGSHLSKIHGFTLDEIKSKSKLKIHTLSSLLEKDDEVSIANSYGMTVVKFAEFWNTHQFDLVFCLGDRFEMSAAVQAGIPFQVKFAHLHGGETTLGAFDNVFRHQITLASTLHFTATDAFSKRVESIIGETENTYTVGALSLDGLDQFVPKEKKAFYQEFSIPNTDFALITFHPETTKQQENVIFAKEMFEALAALSDELFLVITMPNADTLGSVFRNEINRLKEKYPSRVCCIESFGKTKYFTAMTYAKLLIGNTSSGILEAASFGKYVVNVGDRQKGRLQSENVLNVPFERNAIIEKTIEAIHLPEFRGENKYQKPNTAEIILKTLKSYHGID